MKLKLFVVAWPAHRSAPRTSVLAMSEREAADTFYSDLRKPSVAREDHWKVGPPSRYGVLDFDGEDVTLEIQEVLDTRTQAERDIDRMMAGESAESVFALTNRGAK